MAHAHMHYGADRVITAKKLKVGSLARAHFLFAGV